MWRRNAPGFGDEARANEDSDQSISEEDEGLDSECIRNAVSLGREENDKGLSQLEIFRDPFTEESISSHGIKGGCQIEDEVEPPIFNDRSSPSHYDDEKVNPDISRNARENLAITWSEANREVEALVRSNMKPCCSTNHRNVFVKEKKSTRGRSRRKAKAKFSFPFHSDKTDLSLVVSDSEGGTSSDNILVADEIGDVADDEMHNNMAESQLNIHDKQIHPYEMAQKHDTRGHSMAEILGGFLERSDLQEGTPKLEIQKRRRKLAISVRNVPPVGDSIEEDNDLPEALDSDTSFENEDEENAQGVKLIISRTVADQFHEAFRTVSAIGDGMHASFPRPLWCGGSGIYRRLQQVLQIEREREMDSLKNVSVETGFKDEGSILVRILSRSLEAKLIVCSCSYVGDGKNFPRATRTMTIIFNPRMSNDADLEVSNLIRIRSPWKEVQVKNAVIFLCSYFSQV